MQPAKQILTGMEKAFKSVFKSGAKSVLKEFAPHAGRELQKGNGAIMKTFNEVNRALKKL